MYNQEARKGCNFAGFFNQSDTGGIFMAGPKAKTIIERFQEKYRINKKTNCWEWQGYLDRDGYGQLHINQTKVNKAHRLSYEIHKGEISSNLCVCHKCDNPKCVNPEHLFLGTHQDNIKDKVSKGRSKHKENHPMVKLSNKDREAIKQMLDRHPATLSNKNISFGINNFLSRWYGVSHQLISQQRRQ